MTFKCYGCGADLKSKGSVGAHSMWNPGCTPEMRFWGRVDKGPHPKGCWEWQGYRQKFGHGNIGYLTPDGKRRYVLAHRQAWLYTKGPIPDGKWVCHHCDNPPCCNPDHLYIGVRADNVRDIYVRERDARRLSRETVLAIRADLAVETGRGAVKRIADKYGTLDNIVSSIKHGRKYAYYK